MSRFFSAKTVVLSLIGGLLLVGIVLETPRELARWHAAAALEDELNRNFSEAIRHVTRATQLAPDRPFWWRLRAEIQLEANEPEQAVESINRAIELGLAKERALPVRATALQMTGDFQQAAADWANVVEAFQERAKTLAAWAEREEILALYLNNYAYARALARVDLADAEQDAREAIKTVDDRRLRLAPRAYLLLASATTLAEIKQYRRALGCTSEAIRELRALIHRYQSRAMALQDFAPSHYAENVQRLRKMLTAALVEEYRIYRSLDLDEPAREAADAVRRLNGDVEKDGWGVSLQLGIRVSQSLASYLDTLALIQIRRGQPDLALPHAEEAVAIADACSTAFSQLLFVMRRQRTDVRQWEHQQSDLRKSLAVVIYHLGLAHQGAHQEAAAEKDFERVRQLGFTPDDRLF